MAFIHIASTIDRITSNVGIDARYTAGHDGDDFFTVMDSDVRTALGAGNPSTVAGGRDGARGGSAGFAEAGIEPSVGSIGDSYDNALAETVIGLYKTEVIRRDGPWRGIEDVEFATLEWVDWFNQRRLLSSIGDIPPAEFEAMYYATRQSQATEVRLN